MAHLVGTDTWRVRADVGPNTKQGAFVRMNYYKVKPNQGAAFLKLETTGWKPFAESLKDSQISWHLNTLAMPTESYGHYNAMTVDVYPTWEALWKGWPSATEWPRAHPDLPYADYIKQVGDAAERYGADVFRVVLVVAPKKSR